MTTKREAILQAIATAVDATNPVGSAVFRNRTEAYAAGQPTAVVIRPIVDEKRFAGIGPVDSELTFAVDVIGVLSQEGIDDVAEAAYAAIMAGVPGVGDLTPDIHQWEMGGANEDALILTMQFKLLYRHQWGSLNT